MSRHWYRRIVGTTLAFVTAGCAETISPVTLPVQTPPDLGARVLSIHYQQYVSPVGMIAQYELWVAIAPSDTANAGVLVNAAQPVYVQANGALAAKTAADIVAGDSILVWTIVPVPIGPPPPPGAPSYDAQQLVVIR